jgi:uncharacterized protein (TIGR02246 family)
MPPDLQGAVRALYDELLYAWNRRDAKAFAQLFSPTGAIVGFDGSEVEICDVERHLEPIFADHDTAEYVGKVRDVEQLTDDVVLLRALAGMVPPDEDDVNPATNATQSMVAVRAEEGWEIALFQNTPAQHHGHPELVEQDTAELRELLYTTA